MPKRKLTPEDEARAEFLRARMILTLRFMENLEDIRLASQVRDIVEDAARKGDLRTLRMLEREIDASTIALPTHEREGLEAFLQAQLGIDKEEERANMRRKVAKILSRGTIASEKERRRLEDYAEMLEATGGDVSEISEVRQLLDR